MPCLVASDKDTKDGIIAVKETIATYAGLQWEENSNVILQRGENFHGKIWNFIFLYMLIHFS